MIRDDETPKPWYQGTAKALVAGIVAEHAYDRLPILADCLEEEGCDDYDLLSIMRLSTPKMMDDLIGLDRLCAGLVTVPQVHEAKSYMAKLAAEFVSYHDNEHIDETSWKCEADRTGISRVEWMLAVLQDVAETGDRYHCSGYDYPEVNTEEMWGHYQVLTGTPMPKDTWAFSGDLEEYPRQAFSCSC